MIRTKPLISIVDDNPSVRRALKRLVKSAGFGVEVFESAADFLEHGDLEAFGCLILDMRMPGLSGLDLQERLLVSGIHVPVIFITAHEDELARTLALKRGAAAFLQKPFDEQALLDAVRGALGE